MSAMDDPFVIGDYTQPATKAEEREERERLVLVDYMTHMPRAQIAREHNIDPRTVTAIAKRHGVSRPKGRPRINPKPHSGPYLTSRDQAFKTALTRYRNAAVKLDHEMAFGHGAGYLRAKLRFSRAEDLLRALVERRVNAWAPQTRGADL